MSEIKPKSKLYKRLDDDLKEIVEMGLNLDGANYLKCYLMAGIIQELRETYRTLRTEKERDKWET